MESLFVLFWGGPAASLVTWAAGLQPGSDTHGFAAAEKAAVKD
jgi:hypothetical protein